MSFNSGEERVDMCKAIEGMRNDARLEGIKEGIMEGIKEGIKEGVLKTLISLVKDDILTITDAAKRADMTVSEFEEKTGLKA